MGDWQVVDETLYSKGANPLGNTFYGYRRTQLRLPDGRPAVYHGVILGEVVFAVPLEEDLTVHLVAQRRPNARTPAERDVPCVLELPGGGPDPSLSLAASAEKEMCQEIGRRARQMEQLGVLMTAVGIADERDTIFLATGLYPAVDESHDEATEQDLVVVSEPFGRLYDRIRDGSAPVSGQTVAALALLAARL
ncbi:NUDIX domain-containing protein [Micromonospora sp. NPDC003776]